MVTEMKVISSELFWIANLLCLKESFRRRKMQLSNLVFPKPVEYNGDLQSERLLDSRSPGPEQHYKDDTGFVLRPILHVARMPTRNGSPVSR